MKDFKREKKDLLEWPVGGVCLYVYRQFYMYIYLLRVCNIDSKERKYIRVIGFGIWFDGHLTRQLNRNKSNHHFPNSTLSPIELSSLECHHRGNAKRGTPYNIHFYLEAE